MGQTCLWVLCRWSAASFWEFPGPMTCTSDWGLCRYQYGMNTHFCILTPACALVHIDNNIISNIILLVKWWNFFNKIVSSTNSGSRWIDWLERGKQTSDITCGTQNKKEWCLTFKMQFMGTGRRHWDWHSTHHQLLVDPRTEIAHWCIDTRQPPLFAAWVTLAKGCNPKNNIEMRVPLLYHIAWCKQSQQWPTTVPCLMEQSTDYGEFCTR